MTGSILASPPRPPRPSRGRRSAAAPFVVAFALALVAAWLAPVGGLVPATPALAAATDLTLVTDTVYTVQPEQGRVRVTITIVARNNTRETRTRRFYFDHAFLAVQPGISAVKVTGGKSRVRVSKKSGDSTLLRIDFGSRLYSGASRTFKLNYTLADPGEPATRALRVGPSLVTLPVWAHASNGAKGSTVTVRIPDGYDVSVESGSFATQRTLEGGVTELVTEKLATPLKFFAYVSAQKPPVFVETPLTVGTGPDAVSLTLRGWKDDPVWTERIGALIGKSLPALQEEIGLPWPHEEPMVVQEAVSRTAGGYAGVFDPAENRIEVAYWAEHQVVIHEAAHGWFNGALLADRWANEGFASLYAKRVAAAIEEQGASPELTDELAAQAFPLNAWALPETPAETPSEGESPSASPGEAPSASPGSEAPSASPGGETPSASPGGETPAESSPASPAPPASPDASPGASPGAEPPAETPAHGGPTSEAYGFAASLALAEAIAGRAGDDALREVWAAAAAGVGAYQPPAAGPAATTSDTQPETVDGPPDWRGLLDLLEAQTGKDFSDLWRQWVVRPEEAGLLDAREASRIAYERTLALAGDWSLPQSVRDALRAWQFDVADQLMADARTVLAQRTAVTELAARDGYQLPDIMRPQFEAGQLVDASAQAMAERNAMLAIGQAAAARSAEGDVLTTIGMIGEDPESAIAAARSALAAGDLETTMRSADDAYRAWSGGWQEGRRRALLAVAVLATIIVLLSAVVGRIRTGRREHVAAASAVGAAGSGSDLDREPTAEELLAASTPVPVVDDRSAPPRASG